VWVGDGHLRLGARIGVLWVRAILVAFTLLVPAMARAAVMPVNAIEMDASFVERFGRLPTELDDRDASLRVQVHLEWVARRLRLHSERALDVELLARREWLLDALEAYAAEGRFPVNRDHPGRRPRFEDERGRLCAVGHLIAVSAGRPLAHAIAMQFEYEHLLDIHDPGLDAWIEWSGFSVRELATIQPEYRRGGDWRSAVESGRYDEALEILEREYLVSPGLEQLYAIAVVADRGRRYERALQAYREYLAISPDSARSQEQRQERRARTETRIAELELLLRDKAAALPQLSVHEHAEPSAESADGQPQPRAAPPPGSDVHAAANRGCACTIGPGASLDAVWAFGALIAALRLLLGNR
jgi:tetratricopeptide (TPR) repeat protein